jgi:hypothetical protein
MASAAPVAKEASNCRPPSAGRAGSQRLRATLGEAEFPLNDDGPCRRLILAATRRRYEARIAALERLFGKQPVQAD